MATVKTKGEMILVGNNIRIEQGPALVKATANEDLLDNAKTATHYQPGAIDAKGEVIEKGKEFHYLDYGGTETAGKRVFYVYKRRDLTEADQAKLETTYTYVFDEIGVKATEEAALDFAQRHATD